MHLEGCESTIEAFEAEVLLLLALAKRISRLELRQLGAFFSRPKDSILESPAVQLPGHFSEHKNRMRC